MATRGVNFKWYDGFFLTTLAINGIIVAVNSKRYHNCKYPLHIWVLVDHTTIIVFQLMWFVDNGLAAGMGLDFGWQQRYARFCGRVAVLSIISLLLYPFLWGWTVIGTLWYAKAKNCLPEPDQKFFVLIWCLFNYFGLCCIAIHSHGKCLKRRQALMARAQQGTPISVFGVLVDMITVPGWAFEAAEQVMGGMGEVAAAAAYHPGRHLTPAQREALEAFIQELPKFRLKSVPTDCSECPICLEEFVVGDEVRGLPCAHNFHVECIDQWLRLNVKCPRCRSSVFPNLDLSGLTNLRPESVRERSTSPVVNATQHVRAQTLTQSYQLRLQGLLRPVQSVNGGSGNELGSSLEIAGNVGPTTNPVPEHIIDIPSSTSPH